MWHDFIAVCVSRRRFSAGEFGSWDLGRPWGGSEASLALVRVLRCDGSLFWGDCVGIPGLQALGFCFAFGP